MTTLHETHVCRDCGAEITVPYVKEVGYTPGHGHKLPEIGHPPVTWRYKDGCSVTKHADGSLTMTPGPSR